VTWDEACQAVLRDADGALHYTEIAERIVSQGLRGEDVGATPAQTVNATINNSLRQPNSPYVRVRMGEYALRSELRIEPPAAGVAERPVEEPASGALKAFGMYWKRELVIWSRGTTLLGKQSGAASDVNFAEQQGVYLLHDRDRVIYVGRADDTLFGRLKAHTTDRLSGRWDRFSWFGLRAVQQDGSLSEVALDWRHSIVIETLEALLIESLEPPLNRRRGDNLSAAEYSQVEDPELEMMRRQELAARILGKR
jgi:hypothetical protein